MSELSPGLREKIAEETASLCERKHQIQEDRANLNDEERYIDEVMTKVVDFLIEHYIPPQVPVIIEGEVL